MASDAAFGDAKQEARFQQYVRLLETQGYFKNVPRDAPEYGVRLAKARDKFRRKFVDDVGATPGVETPATATTATTATTTTTTATTTRTTTSAAASM